MIRAVTALIIGGLVGCGVPPGDVALQPVVRADAQLAASLVLVEMSVLASPTACTALTEEPLIMQTEVEVMATASLVAGATETFKALKSGSYLVVGEGFDADGRRVARGCVVTQVGLKREVARVVVQLSAL